MSAIIGSTRPILEQKYPGNSPISVKELSGQQITLFIRDIGQAIRDVYKEWPYLYEGTVEEQEEYVQKRYIDRPDSVVCAAFDQKQLIGLAMGVPLCDAPAHYLTPFISDNLCMGMPLKDIFYWGELIVRPECRQKGIAKQLCNQLENHIITKGYKAIAFCTVERPTDFHLNNLKPENHFSPDSRWGDFGFTKHEDLTFKGEWRLVEESEESKHHMVYWFKKL